MDETDKASDALKRMLSQINASHSVLTVLVAANVAEMPKQRRDDLLQATKRDEAFSLSTPGFKEAAVAAVDRIAQMVDSMTKEEGDDMHLEEWPLYMQGRNAVLTATIASLMASLEESNQGVAIVRMLGETNAPPGAAGPYVQGCEDQTQELIKLSTTIRKTMAAMKAPVPTSATVQ